MKHLDLEETLLKFINEKQQTVQTITSRIMTKLAKKLATSLEIKNIKFTWGWFIKCLRRNNLPLRAPTTRIRKQLKTMSMEKFHVHLRRSSLK